MSIFVYGSLAFDIIFSVSCDFRKSIPLEEGEIKNFNASFIANEKREYPGGTAGNISFWLGKNSTSSTLFSAWGKDFSQKGYRQRLEKLGAEIFGPEGEFTAHAYMVSDPLHQQLIIWQANAYEKIEKVNLRDHLDLKSFKYAIFSAGSPTSILKHLIEFRKENSQATIIFDPGQVAQFFDKNAFLECCRSSDIIIGNQTEFTHFQQYGIPDGMTEIETLGESGALLRQNSKEEKINPVPVKNVVETTGAGDAFRAGLLAGLSGGKSLLEASELGAELGAQCVQMPSAQG